MKKQFTAEQLQWLEALESDKYQQTGAVLCRKMGDDMEYCCLGVAMALFDPDDVSMKLHSLDTYRKRSAGMALNSKVQELLKLKGPEGHSYITGEKPLTALNDSGWSFKAIAEVLRYRPEAYFENFQEYNDDN